MRGSAADGIVVTTAEHIIRKTVDKRPIVVHRIDKNTAIGLIGDKQPMMCAVIREGNGSTKCEPVRRVIRCYFCVHRYRRRVARFIKLTDDINGICTVIETIRERNNTVVAGIRDEHTVIRGIDRKIRRTAEALSRGIRGIGVII